MSPCAVAFLENADQIDLRTESLLAQYHLVKRRTSSNGTYSQAGRGIHLTVCS